jgi:hypothetical protein
MVKLGVLLVSVLVGGLSAASLFGPAAEAGHVTRCFDKRADINRSHDPLGSSLVGTARQDVIIASESGDRVEGRGGRDLICGIGDVDVILGEGGSDKLSGGRGRDEIRGGKGDDLLRGGPGRDKGKGGPGTDICVDIEVRRSCRRG